MSYEANGETWDVSLSDEEPREGIRPLLFRCTSNTSRGWRVVEVPAAEYPDGRLDDLSTADLDALFERSQPFDYTHDPKAEEGHVGDTGGIG